jgi:hypothetical protein
MTTLPAPIPSSRALVPSRRHVPALRRVALATRHLQLAPVARAAGALAVGLAAEGVLRALVTRRERESSSIAAVPRAVPTVATAGQAPPFDAVRAIEGFRGARLVITEYTVIERRRAR